MLPADACPYLARDFLMKIVQVMQLTGGRHLLSLIGRVSLIREVVHPAMPCMRAVFGGVGLTNSDEPDYVLKKNMKIIFSAVRTSKDGIGNSRLN